LVDDTDDDFANIRVLNLKGNCYAALGNRDTSLVLFRQAQRVSRLNKDTFSLIKSWLALSGSHLEFSAYLQAYTLIDSANTLAVQLKDTSLIIESILSQAKLSYYKDEYDDAYKWLREAARYSDGFQDPNWENLFYAKYIPALLKFYEDEKEDSSIFLYKQSIKYLDTSIVSDKYLNALSGISDNYIFKAQQNPDKGFLDSSSVYADRCLELLEKYPNTMISQMFYRSALINDREKGDYINAELKFDSLFNLAKKWPPFFSEGFFGSGESFFRERAQHFKEKGNLEAANVAYQKALEYLDQQSIAANERNLMDQKIAIEEVQHKYLNDVLTVKNEKLLAEKEKAETRARLLQVVTIGAGLAIIIVVVIMILIRRNLENRRQLAEAKALLKDQELAELKKRQQMERMGALLEGQEKERSRIAAELHDGIGGLLASTKHQFQLVESKMKNQVPEFSKAYHTLDETAHEVRRISHNMASKTLNKFGFEAAVKDLAETLNSDELSIHLNCTDLPTDLSSDIQLNLYRVIQELIGNILKHSGATVCNIDITAYDDELVLLVEDNGKGFDPNKKSEHEGIGLSNMKVRVEHLDGTIEFDSSPEHGTTVVVNIPLPVLV
jgi:signal transduction histidine kinase